MPKRNIRSLLTRTDDVSLREISGEYPVPFDQEKLFQKSYAKYQGTERPAGVMRRVSKRTPFRALTAAACLILTVGLSVGVWSKQQRIEPRIPQETAVTSLTQTTAASTASDTAAPTSTETQTTRKQTETSRTFPETSSIQPEVIVPAQTAVTAAPPASDRQTAPTTAAQTRAAAAPVTSLPAVQTTPVYQTYAPVQTAAPSTTAATAPPQTTVSMTTATTCLPETTAQTVDTTATRPSDSKEEFKMKVQILKKMQTVIAAAVSTAAVATIPAATTIAAEISTDPPQDIVTQYGDVNLDQDVSLSDLVQLQRYLLGQKDSLGNWANADLCEDGEIDIFDLGMLKQELVSASSSVGGTLKVNVVDVMTGKPLENTRIMLMGLSEDNCYPVLEWNYDSSKAEEQVLRGLPTDPDYTYMISLCSLPEGYGNEFGNWDQQYFFYFDEGETDKEVNVYVVAADEPSNIHVSMMDWSRGEEVNGIYGLVCITDREGHPYYPTVHFSDLALPDGEYHAYVSPFEYPVQLISPDSEYAKKLQAIDPTLTFEDQTAGFDFTVKDGKPDREVRFNFGPKDGMYNHITVNSWDAVNDKPLSGVQFSLIANPKTNPTVVETWVSDETGSKTFDDLMFSGLPAYTIHVDKRPDGYDGGFDQHFHAGYVYNYSQEFNFVFYPEDTSKNFSADVLHWEDKTAFGEEDYLYEIWRINDEATFDYTKVYDSVSPGMKIALEDGDYFASITNLSDAKKDGYVPITYTNYTGTSNFDQLGLSLEEFCSTTAMINISIRDGKPTRPAVFYLKQWDETDDIIPQEAYDYWDKQYEKQMHPAPEGDTE